MSRRKARGRRAAARALALGPGLALLLGDVAIRGGLLRDLTRPAWIAYLACAATGAVVWGALVVAAARRRGASRWAARAGLAVLAVLAVGTQLQTWARYGAYLNWRTALMGNSLWPCLSQQLWGDRARALGILAAPAAVALAMVVATRRLAPPRRTPARGALVLAVAGVVAVADLARPDAGWDSGTTPDVLWLSATGALVKSLRSGDDVMVTLKWLPAARSAAPVPRLQAAPARARSVLVVLGESLRASDVCSVPSPAFACESTPFTNAALPHRLGLSQMRALDSTTALSMATILTGLGPASPRSALLSAPLLFEYAHAAGIDTAFWTSQNLLYANAGRFLDGTPLHFFASGTDLEPYADYLDGADDARLLERVATDLPALREPFFALVQLANTHFPYKVDDHDHPFSSTRDWPHMDAFGRTAVRYLDALHRQDRLVARFLQALPREGTVVVFLADHGEQLGERRRTGHTWTSYDVELHVPMWIDAAPGTLTDAEVASLRALRDVPVTMLDVAPTILDLLGVWEDPALGPRRGTMAGVSLLRGPPPADRAVVTTNCSALFSCSSRNWGAMRGTTKLLADETDDAWRCYDVASDPEEQVDLGAAACGDLRSIAEADGRGAPFGEEWSSDATR